MDNLFNTIIAMNKSEKLFFRREFKDSEPPMYIKIYDLIIRSRTTDYQLLNKKIKELNLGDDNYLKHILLNKLLQSNMLCNNQQNSQIELLNEISIIISLREKNQLELALRKWHLAYEKCKQLGMYNFLEILLQEKLKIELLDNLNFDIKKHKEFLAFIKSHTFSFSQLQKLRLIYQDLIFLRKQSYVLSDSNKILFNSILAEFKKMPSTSDANFIEYEFLHATCLSIIDLFQLNFESAIIHLKKIFTSLKSSNSFLNNNNEFILDLIRLNSDLHFFAKKYESIPTLINFCDSIKLSNSSYQQQLNIIIFLIKNRYLNTTTQYSLVEKLFKESEQYFNLWIDFSSKEIKKLLCVSLAVSYFIASKFQNALFYSNQGLSIFNKSQRQETISFFYLFELLIAFELKNNAIFESKFHNAYTHFRKYKQYENFGLNVIQGLNRIYQNKNSKNKSELFATIFEEINNNKDNSLDILFTYFDIPLWLESKINKISYKEYRIRLFNNING